MLYRIAHNRQIFARDGEGLPSLRSRFPDRSEQFRSAIFLGLCDDEGRDEHFISLFQVL